MEQLAASITVKSVTAGFDELRTELFRKSIHMMIALVPAIASFDRGLAIALLGGGAIIYTYSEYLRAQGLSVALISGIKALALRERDMERFAAGPVTLAIGAMAALLFYPATAAKIAIYALAFGDGFASVAGKLFGKNRIPYTGGKTYEGSFACFLAVFFSTWKITENVVASLYIAILATVAELLPIGDYDNFLIPVTAGYAAIVLL